MTQNNMKSENKQLGINMVASVLSLVSSYAINFFLTPYIVEKLGVEAYGFVGLSTQFIGYFSLITIALNSMSGRFVTIEYHRGNIEGANKYLSSTFIGNVFLSIIILFISCFLVLYLDLVIDIPENLIYDVKLLFAFLSINCVLGLLTNFYGVSPFIKNRLDYTNLRNVLGNILRSFALVFLFMFFAPKIWYFGVTTLIATLYITSMLLSK